MLSKLYKFTIISFITFTTIVILGEAYLRWHYFALPTDKNHLPHPFLQNILHPNIEINPGEFLYKNGLRNTGQYHEDENTYKIIAIGDSCTFSVAISDEFKSYPSRLERGLMKKFGQPVEVFNAGIPGYNSMQMFLKLHYEFKNIPPDEVIIYGGWNDFRVLMHDRGELYVENNTLGLPKVYRHGTYWELAQKIPFGINKILSWSFLYNHVSFKIKAHYVKKDIVAFWKKNGLDSMPESPLILPEVIINYQNNIESIISLAKGRGAKVAIITLATPLREKYTSEQEKEFLEKYGNDIGNFLRLTPAEEYYYVKQFNQILRRLSKKYNTELYDWAEWHQKVDDESLFDDVLHPNAKGYAFLVQKIVTQKDKL